MMFFSFKKDIREISKKSAAKNFKFYVYFFKIRF